MAIATGSGLRSILNTLCVKPVVICRMHIGVELGSSKIGQRLSRRMTTLAIEIWFCRLGLSSAVVRSLRQPLLIEEGDADRNSEQAKDSSD